MMARDYWFIHVSKALSVVWFATNAPEPTRDQAIDRLKILWQTGPNQIGFYYSWAFANALTTKSLALSNSNFLRRVRRR